MSIRSFIAIPIPEGMANALGDAAAAMAYQDKSNAVRWVDQANYHVTLAFLGEQQESDLEVLAEQLDINLPQDGFSMTIDYCSPFPEARPKLIAAMVGKDNLMQELYRQVMTSIVASQIQIEKRRFNPHITLGRLRTSKNRFVGAIPTAMQISTTVGEVAIYQSTLTPSGAEYDALFRFPLEQFEYHADEI